MLDLLARDAVALARMIEGRQISSFELVQAAIGRINQINPAINAVVTHLFDSALACAQRRDIDLAEGRKLGPLHGIPVLIKDLFDFRSGVRNTFGCPAFADFTPNQTCEHVARLEAAGAVILGKTNTPEFGHKGTTDNRLFGPTSTPFDLTRNAGGSSGGSAAAVAVGMVALAQGSDAGGSVRIPAAWCGVVGFKPSFGRIPLTGGPNAFGSHTPFVHVGPLTRTVRDAALMTRVLAGPHPRDPFSIADDGLDWLGAVARPLTGVRVAFSPDFGVFAVDPEIARLVREASRALSEAGAHVDEPEIRLPCSQHDLAMLWRRQVGVFYAEFFASLGAAGMPISDDDLPNEVRAMMDYGRSASALAEREDQWLRTRIFHALQDVFDNYDLVVTPTLACPPVLNERGGATLGPAAVNGVRMERCIGWCLTHPINFTGHPAASVPAGMMRDGLPVGMQIVGRRFDDGMVLAACRAVEERRPWLPALVKASRRIEAHLRGEQ